MLVKIPTDSCLPGPGFQHFPALLQLTTLSPHPDQFDGLYPRPQGFRVCCLVLRVPLA